MWCIGRADSTESALFYFMPQILKHRNRPRPVKKSLFFSGLRICYMNKYSPFLDFRGGHRILYLLIFNENILFLHEIADSESANVLKSVLFTQLVIMNKTGPKIVKT
jgi:hypothetical protein